MTTKDNKPAVSNFQRLSAKRWAMLAIPPGCPDPLKAGVRVLTDRERLLTLAREADAWVRNAIAAVRSAADPNPWRNSTDEEIAGEVLRQIEERERARKTREGFGHG